jgi:hypothetical protein
MKKTFPHLVKKLERKARGEEADEDELERAEEFVR